MTDFRGRVTIQTAIGVAALAAVAGAVGGPPALIGVLAAGALAVGNFWWLSRSASSAAEPGGGHGQVGGWIVAAGARHAVLFGAFALLCGAGYGHPVGVVLGLSVLPCALVVQGLRSARQAD